MKKPVISVALIVLMAAAAHAQVVVSSGGQSGVGGYYGWGGYGTRGGGMNYGYTSGYGYLYSQGSPAWGFGGGYGYGYPSSGYYGGYGYGGYGGGYRHGWFGRVDAATSAAGPLARSAPVADRLPEYTSAREIEEGRRRFKMGDYKGAVDQFRAAVAAHTENPLAQAWFAVGLAVTGDGRNADKALRAAAAGGLAVDRMALADGFYDGRERTRLTGVLAKVSGEGSLAAAFALSLAGEGAKLKQLAEKDAVARQLLPKP